MVQFLHAFADKWVRSWLVCNGLSWKTWLFLHVSFTFLKRPAQGCYSHEQRDARVDDGSRNSFVMFLFASHLLLSY